MTYATIDALRESLAQPAHRSPEYVAKMMHDVPDAETVDRAAFVLSRVAGKAVLDVGASGPLHEAVVKAARRCYGIDRPQPLREHECRRVGSSAVVEMHGRKEFVREVMCFFDLDDVTLNLPSYPDVDIVLCGEVLEHLGNPLYFLTRLRRQYPHQPVIVTAPNAFSDIARKHMQQGTENVNLDHTCWFSWRTLRTLVERAGYTAAEFAWYNGEPGFAEGLVFVLQPGA